VLALTCSVHGLAALDKPWTYTLSMGLGMGCAAAALTAGFAAYFRSTLGPARQRLARASRWSIPALLLGSLLGNLAAPETFAWPHASLLGHLGCLALTLVSEGALAALSVRALRYADPVTPRVTAAYVGAMAGAWAALAVSLQCVLTDPLHTLGTHVLPVGVLMLFTVRFGARALGLAPR
jgi:hypothetical protein